jgi:hypothetical protein
MMRPDSDSTPNRSFAAWLRLAKPIPATFGGEPVMVLDIGPSGALLSGQGGYPLGFEQELAFRDRRGNVSVRALVTGVEDHGESPQRDLLVRFRERGDGLTEFIDSYQQQIHRAEVANADGDIAHNVIDGDRMLSDLGSAARANEPYLRCRMRNGAWTREITRERDQPPDGFTISAAEADEQVSLLQLAYEESDDDGRNALREFAAVSLPPT